jgi:polyribonucleotide nucleotidyltransferase
VRRTEDVVKMGEMIWVKCIGIDERTGKVRLSRRAAMKERETAQQATPADASAAPADSAPLAQP